MTITRLELASSSLLQVPSDLERLGPGIKFHPMGTGKDFMKRGVRAYVSADSLALIAKWVKAQKWKSSILNKAANARHDGKWLVDPTFEQRNGQTVTTHLFLGNPDAKGNSDVLVVSKIYRTQSKGSVVAIQKPESIGAIKRLEISRTKRSTQG